MDALAKEQLAKLEAEHWWFIGRRALCLALERATRRAPSTGRVLDVGSGVGGFLDPLTQISDSLYHLDSVPEHLQACRQRGHLDGVQALAAPLPFLEASFDLVCLFDVLEHTEDDSAVMQEIARVLTPGGRALFHVPAHPWLFAQNDRVSGHYRRYTRHRLRSLCQKAGLEVQRLSGSNLLLFPLIAPAILTMKACEALGWGSHRSHTNLSLPFPPLINQLLAWVYKRESRWAARFNLPTGHSYALVARKP